MKTIISVSAGLDSTYLLWRLLSNTSDEITAVFMDASDLEFQSVAINKYDFRWMDNNEVIKSRKNTINQICNWLKENVRDFTLEIHTMDITRLHKGLASVNKPNGMNTYFIDLAVERINNNEFDRIACANERQNDGYSHGGSKNGVRRPGAMEFYDRFVAAATRGQIDFILTDEPYTQANALLEMPQVLIDMTSSCVVETSFQQPCGTCVKCIKRKFFCDQIAAGKTAQEIYDLVESKCVQDDGTWISMKYWMMTDDITTCPKWPMPQWPNSYRVT
jgi:7-cyano-7-deazaguanine synthase in queuosine biosynthesis